MMTSQTFSANFSLKDIHANVDYLSLNANLRVIDSAIKKVYCRVVKNLHHDILIGFKTSESSCLVQ